MDKAYRKVDAPAEPAVCVIDDDGSVRDSLRELLQSYGFRIHDYSSAAAFLSVEHSASNTCLIVDLHMPGMSGVELLEQLHDEGRRFPAILMTGRRDTAALQRAAEAGAFACLDKPAAGDALVHHIHQAFASRTAT